MVVGGSAVRHSRERTVGWGAATDIGASALLTTLSKVRADLLTFVPVRGRPAPFVYGPEWEVLSGTESPAMNGLRGCDFCPVLWLPFVATMEHRHGEVARSNRGFLEFCERYGCVPVAPLPY